MNLMIPYLNYKIKEIRMKYWPPGYKCEALVQNLLIKFGSYAITVS